MKSYILTPIILSIISASCETRTVRESPRPETVIRYIKNDSLVTSWEGNVISFLNSSKAQKDIDSVAFNNQFFAFGELHGTKGFHYKYVSDHSIFHFGKKQELVTILFDSEFSKQEIEYIFNKGNLISRPNLEFIIGKHFDNDTITIGKENIDGPSNVKFQLFFRENNVEKIKYVGFKFD